MSPRRLPALPLAASVAWNHVRDDPVRAAMLALRLVPRQLKARAFRAVAAALPGAVLPEAVRLWDAGHREEALRLARAKQGPPRAVRRRAAWAAAVERPESAGRGTAYGPQAVPVPPGGAIRPVAGRVLHVVTNALPYKNAGYTIRTQAIARAQREAGLDPHIVTRLGFPVAQGVLDARPSHEVDGVPYHRLLPLRMPASPAAALARNAELAAGLVERLRPSVLHAATDHPNGRIALALREAFGIPVVYEVRGFLEETWLTQAPGRTADCESYRARRALETYCMRSADLVLTLGEAMKEEIVARGVAADKVLLVPNAVDDVFLQPLPDAAALRARLGISPDDLVVGTVSSLTPHEGIDTLLRAGAELRRRGIPLRLLIVGDGPQRPVLQRQAAELGLQGAAVFTGRVPYGEVRAHHALLDVFAVPRTGERVCHLVTPLKPVEAMASGLPVAASDVRAMGELVEDGVNGSLIPPGSPDSWADALEVLLYSPNRMRSMGVAARAHVARDRTWARVAARTGDAYRSLGAV